MGGRSAGRVPHSPPLVRQIKRCGGTDKIGGFFCPTAQGRTGTIVPSGARRCQTRAQCDWALAGPLQSADPHSAPLPTGTPPTLLVLFIVLVSCIFLMGLAATGPTPSFDVASAPTPGCPTGKAPFAPHPTGKNPTPPLRSAFLRIAPRPCASVPIELAARPSATRRSARAGLEKGHRGSTRRPWGYQLIYFTAEL